MIYKSGTSLLMEMFSIYYTINCNHPYIVIVRKYIVIVRKSRYREAQSKKDGR